MQTAQIWGPHYWNFLHTITMNYPLYPNTVVKKKYYEFIQNLPMFMPESFDFRELLDEYPVSPYLDSRKSFVRWMHFIHNKINEKLHKKKISSDAFYTEYYNQTIKKENNTDYKIPKIYLHFALLVILLLLFKFS